MFGAKLIMTCLGVLLTGVTWSEATTLRCNIETRPNHYAAATIESILHRRSVFSLSG